MNKKACIIVLYKHQEEKLCKTIKSIINQVDYILIINNNSDLYHYNNEKVKVINLKENKGIAYALNKGIEFCSENDISFALMSDQDSCFFDGFMNNMIENINRLKIPKGIYAPTFINNIKNQIEPISIGLRKRIIPSKSVDYYEVKHVITSGTVLDLRGGKVEKFNEFLYIDFVDFEWCWRMNSHGYRVVVFPNIVMEHELGDDYVKILGIKITLRTPIRYYYMIRNCLYLGFRSKNLRASEKTYMIYWGFKMILGVVLLDNRKGKSSKNLYLAIKDAIFQNMGEKKNA